MKPPEIQRQETRDTPSRVVSLSVSSLSGLHAETLSPFVSVCLLGWQEIERGRSRWQSLLLAWRSPIARAPAPLAQLGRGLPPAGAVETRLSRGRKASPHPSSGLLNRALSSGNERHSKGLRLSRWYSATQSATEVTH